MFRSLLSRIFVREFLVQDVLYLHALCHYAARCATLRDEVCVFLVRNADKVLRDLIHLGAWGPCVTVHSDNK